MAESGALPSLINGALKQDGIEKSRSWELPALAISPEERAQLSALVESEKDASCLAIEWVVDVADNHLNWFIATAYVYDDESRTIRVAIPDRDEPQWEGDLPLDHRMVHLIECCDVKSMALYKHIISLATRKVKWRVSWWIENTDGADGVWKSGVAHYFGRLSNVLFVSVDGASGNQLIEVGVDENLKLCEVLTQNGGHADFEQLVVEGVVQWTGPSSQNPEELLNAPDAWKSIVARPSFWQAVSTGLFFRRRYSIGDKVEVILCKGTESKRGRVAAVHGNDTYDVDLEDHHAPEVGDQPEIGFQIPPEYLRPVGVKRKTSSSEKADHPEALKTTVGDLYRQRQSLREELEALSREREILEVAQQVEGGQQRSTREDIINQRERIERIGGSLSRTQTAKTPEHGAEHLNDTSSGHAVSKANAAVDAGTNLEKFKPVIGESSQDIQQRPQARCWLGSLSCSGQPFTPHVASALLPLPDTIAGKECTTEALKSQSEWAACENQGGESLARLDRFDIIAVALQDCNTTCGCIADEVRTNLALDDDKEHEGDWCMTAVESKAGSAYLPGAKASSLVVFSRREVLWENENSLKSAAAPTDSGLSSVAVYLQLRDGARVALLSANTNLLDQSEFSSIPSRNAHVAAHFQGNAVEAVHNELLELNPLDVSRECDYVFFIGDLGYSYDIQGNDVKRRDIVDLVTRSDWASLSLADAMHQEKAAHHVFSGWETITPRFSPTAFLRTFEATKCANEEVPLPCWSERVLWKSLPGLEDCINLELYNKRELSTEGGLGELFDHDALVAGFMITSRQAADARSTAPWVSALFASLHATFMTNATPDLAIGSEFFVTLALGRDARGGERRTAMATLTQDEDGKSQKQVIWDDKLRIDTSQDSPDHIFLRVNAAKGHAPHSIAAGCVFSVRRLAEALTIDSNDDEPCIRLEEPLVSGGTLRGWLHGQVVLSQDTGKEVDRGPELEAEQVPSSTVSTPSEKAASGWATPKSRSSSLKAVSKGLKSIMFGRKKK